jgi:hypothetical protein
MAGNAAAEGVGGRTAGSAADEGVGGRTAGSGVSPESDADEGRASGKLGRLGRLGVAGGR